MSTMVIDNDVDTAIRASRSRKTSEADNVTYEVIKEGYSVLSPNMRKLYQACILIKHREIMKLDIIRRKLSQVFKRLGSLIGRHPYFFIIIPILISLASIAGIFKLRYKRNVINSLKADSGHLISTEKFLEETWKTASVSDEIRFTQVPDGVMLFIINRNRGENMLEKKILHELQVVDSIVKNCTIEMFNRTIGYGDICAKVRNKCYENPFFEIMYDADNFLTEKRKFKYPVDIDNLTYSYHIYVMSLGGVTIDGNDYVKRVQAVRLLYLIDRTDKVNIQFGDSWVAEVYQRIQNYNFQYIKPFINALWLIENDIKTYLYDLRYIIAACVSFICVFSMTTLMSHNILRSKPWMGLACVFSAGMAIVTSFGILGYCGMENAYTNICIPFLVLVTEVDDSFVLIASWRITDSEKCVEKRMADTFAAAGVSITLTSITNLFSYFVGMTAPIVVVKIFCIYCATCIFFTYVFQITFFAGCMALSGYREEKGLHPITFKAYAHQEEDFQRIEKNEECLMRIIRDKLGDILYYTPTKAIVLILYLINLGCGCFGMFFIKQGLEYQKMYPSDSEMYQGSRMYYEYFTEYTFPVHIIINKTLDYSDKNVQKSVENLLRRFESHPHVADSRFTVSWLKYYKEVQKNPIAKYAFTGYNMSNKDDFMEGLRVFLRFKPAEQFSNDLVFSPDGSEITCSRFFVVTKNIRNREIEIATMNDFFKIADEASFPVIVHSIIASLVEQGLIIDGLAKQLFWMTGLLIAIVFFSVIPNIFCSLVVAVCVVSTTIETLGYMSLWGINLDIISLTSLILCVGFCVNYPAHIAYAFVTSNCKTSKDRMKDSLYHVGFPIIQGTFSTVIGILFIYKDSYGVLTFLKVVCLITMETAFHALFFTPVVLSFLHSRLCFKQKANFTEVTERFVELNMNQE
ncbi:patched domain-containing protein 3-like [Centruroides sculpturatus]|uniref:patched domain-containing protein 3-like n=1 Tax=Centruroides sculpturatus TaxID=218467 RepID=UPI000C6EC8C7|nr:patched domain-containing protein 3-like [Centruroides sculpturatus]